jgi:hypothetical protein
MAIQGCSWQRKLICRKTKLSMAMQDCLRRAKVVYGKKRLIRDEARLSTAKQGCLRRIKVIQGKTTLSATK